MNTHMCKRTCSRRSHGENIQVNCFICDRIAYLGCFKITINKVTQKSFFKADSPVQYICQQCRPASGVLNPTTDKSTDKNNHIGEAPSNVQNTIDSTIPDKIDQILNVLTNMYKHNDSDNTKMIKIIDDRFEEIRNISTNFDGLEAKINKKIDGLSNMVTHPPIDYARIEEIVTLNKCNNKIFTRSVCNSATNSLDWSFSSLNQANTSSAIEPRHDLYHLWHSFESNTWSSFDSITGIVKDTRNKVDEIHDRLGSIDLLPEFNTKDLNKPAETRSTLVEIIERDSDHRCRLDKIENELCNLNDNIRSLTSKLLENHELSVINSQAIDSAGNPVITDKPKEAMSHKNQTKQNKVVSESFKRGQKMLMHDPLDDRPGNGVDIQDAEMEDDVLNVMERIESENSDHVPALDLLNIQLPIQISAPTINHKINPEPFEFHISNFDKNTTSECIFNYIKSRGIPDTDNIKINKLIPRNRDFETLKFINFKIDTHNEMIAKVIQEPEFWPKPCKINRFIQRSPRVAILPNANKNKNNKNNNFL